jgi:hypothetical protein
MPPASLLEGRKIRRITTLSQLPVIELKIVDERDEDHRISYSVFDLYVVGCRFVDDYDQDAAVDYYLKLHPDSDRRAVRAELELELSERGVT